jgi:hypothetical protein
MKAYNPWRITLTPILDEFVLRLHSINGIISSMIWKACMDESGDLGFDFSKAKTPRKFCITLVLAKDERKLEKIIKRTFSDFTHLNIKHPTGILHSYHETKRTKMSIIRRLKETDAMVFTIYADKTKLKRRDVNEFYNDLTILLVEKVFSVTSAEKIILTASRKSTDDVQNEKFINSIKSAFSDSIEVSIKKPGEAKSLQIADCASWSVFRYYEYDDDEYYNELKPILHEYKY